MKLPFFRFAAHKLPQGSFSYADYLAAKKSKEPHNRGQQDKNVSTGDNSQELPELKPEQLAKLISMKKEGQGQAKIANALSMTKNEVRQHWEKIQKGLKDDGNDPNQAAKNDGEPSKTNDKRKEKTNALGTEFEFKVKIPTADKHFSSDEVRLFLVRMSFADEV
jgi:hypothetical protein